MIPIIDLTVPNDFDQNDLLYQSKEKYDRQEDDVAKIIHDIKENGDEALLKFTEKFDGVKLNQIKVSDKEIEEAVKQVNDDLLCTIKRASRRIESYHEKQKTTSWFTTEEGEILGQLITPIEKVGVYVPGGSAVYPSSLLMNVIPAKVAGVKEIVMTSPPKRNGKIDPTVLATAALLGIKDIYKVGGAQAIAAMAYGTETVKRVYKIVGPGNIYVALAKKMVYGTVNIDSVAGPSEILILADDQANAQYVAADLLSQAEHDELAASILLTTSKDLAYRVREEIKKQIATLSRKKILEASLKNWGKIIIMKDMEDAIDFANAIAPEHLEICTMNPFEIMTRIRNAGAIFLGNYSPEPLGDYMAGPNHVLPTGGTAKFFSPLNVHDFTKKSSVISFSKQALYDLKDDVLRFAKAEELTAHARAIEVRFE